MYIFMDDCLTLENQLVCSGWNYFSHSQIFSVAYSSLKRVKASLGSHLSGHNGEILCVWLLMLLGDHNLKATSLYCYFLNYFLMFSLSHNIFLLRIWLTFGVMHWFLFVLYVYCKFLCSYHEAYTHILFLSHSIPPFITVVCFYLFWSVLRQDLNICSSGCSRTHYIG